jgi:hypothetical protein
LLVGSGVAITIAYSLPLIRNEVHEHRIAYLSFKSDEVGTWFTLKLETEDLFTAFNPINVSVHTGAVDTNIRTIQLEFQGASSYFLGEYNFSDPSFFPEQYEKLRKAIESNIFHLQRNSLTTFAGSKQNLTYTTGGEFDIGITVTYQDGRVIGYGLGNIDFALKKAIRISPPEALVQLRNGNYTLGLAYAAVGLTLVAVGLTAVLDIVIKYVIR